MYKLSDDGQAWIEEGTRMAAAISSLMDGLWVGRALDDGIWVKVHVFFGFSIATSLAVFYFTAAKGSELFVKLP